MYCKWLLGGFSTMDSTKHYTESERLALDIRKKYVIKQ